MNPVSGSSVIIVIRIKVSGINYLIIFSLYNPHMLILLVSFRFEYFCFSTHAYSEMLNVHAVSSS